MPRIALLAAAPLAVAAFVLVLTGVVELPDLEHALTELSETLGTWTYLLVGGLAFLETGAFVGPGRAGRDRDRAGRRRRRPG